MGKSRALSIVVATAAATLVTGMTSAPAGAASTYDPAPAKSGAAWLSDQVTDGLVHNEQYDFDDVGLSIDVALGLDAAGKKPTVVKAITKAVAKNVAFYTAFAPSVYAGPTAKAAVLALSQDKNPHAFGGVDLVTQLEARVATTAPITGRIEDAFDPTDEFGGDYANVIGQAYAAQALSLVGSAKADVRDGVPARAAVRQGLLPSVLHRRQDAHRPVLPGRPARRARRQHRRHRAGGPRALQDVKGSKAKAAVKKAVDWLVGHPAAQRCVHRHREGEGAVNTNSTGLAGWALGEAGATERRRAAAAAVRALQVGAQPVRRQARRSTSARSPTTSTALTTPAQDKGITKKTSDQWRRASAQALPVLRWAPRGRGRLHRHARRPDRGRGSTSRPADGRGRRASGCA